MTDQIVVRRLDRRPVRNPQRTDASRLVQDLGDVSAAFEDGDAQRVVFDRRRAAAAIAHGDTRYPREAWKTNAPARRTLQFRAELYNALNSMQVSTVNTTATFDAN